MTVVRDIDTDSTSGHGVKGLSARSSVAGSHAAAIW